LNRKIGGIRLQLKGFYEADIAEIQDSGEEYEKSIQ
jgi:hypothetical protein